MFISWSIWNKSTSLYSCVLYTVTFFCQRRCLLQGIGRQFKIIDDDGNKSLDRNEFYKGCNDFGAGLTKAEMDAVFDRIDMDGSGSLNFDEFLEALRPPMSNTRKQLIDQAFRILDKTCDGEITVEDLKVRRESQW